MIDHRYLEHNLQFSFTIDSSICSSDNLEVNINYPWVGIDGNWQRIRCRSPFVA